MPDVPAPLSDAVAFISDRLTSAAIGWSVEPFKRLINQRCQDALSYLMEELRLGDITKEEFVSRDDNLGNVLRLLQCATEGSARRNLRMLAQVIKNQHLQGSRTQDEFQRWAPILASLSNDEIVVLGVMHRCTLSAKMENPMDSALHTANAFNAAKEEVLKTNILAGDGELLEAALAGLTRTGLVITKSAFSAIQYKVSPLLERLTKLIEMEKFADEIIEEERGATV